MRLRELRDAWKDVGLKAREAAQSQDRPCVARVIHRLVKTSEDVAAVLKETLTGRREGDASWASLEEPDPEFILHFAKLATERRLGRVQTHPGRFAEAPFLRDGHEIAQMPKLQLPISVRHGT
jgi:hypothetical protein